MRILLSSLFILLSLSQHALAQYYSLTQPRGYIQRAYVKYYDTDTVTIVTGYGECNGEYWEIVSDTNHDMTSLASAEDYHYIYIDYSASSFPTITVIDTTTEPVWSDAKQGWYNGDDRCLGVVWSPSGSATVFNFATDGDGRYWTTTTNIKQLVDDADPTGNYVSLEATAYSPVNSNALLVSGRALDSDGNVTILIQPAEETYAELCGDGHSGYANVQGWMPIQIGWSRDLEWYGNDDDDSDVRIQIWGYRIER
ncbi:MAG: hypothetical protein AB1454_11525 [Candidatus Auribacterota bacterium]